MRQEFNTSATRRRRCAADCFRAPGSVEFRWLDESGCNDENIWCTMTGDTLRHIATLYDTHVQLPSTKSNQPMSSWSKLKKNLRSDLRIYGNLWPFPSSQSFSQNLPTSSRGVRPPSLLRITEMKLFAHDWEGVGINDSLGKAEFKHPNSSLTKWERSENPVCLLWII